MPQAVDEMHFYIPKPGKSGSYQSYLALLQHIDQISLVLPIAFKTLYVSVGLDKPKVILLPKYYKGCMPRRL